ncbi:MAG: DUF3732 domain-containing protein [Rubripirellula sp.]
MNFQIASIAIYSHAGERREVPFRCGAVNIITGASKTGKSALITIVDYCLGRASYLIPAGKIRNCVAWYAVKIQLDSGQLVIARPAPERGVQSNTEAFLAEGNELEFPDFGDLRKTTNTDGLAKFLSGVLGITENKHIPGESQSREPLSASIKHAKFLVFQPQNRIADQTSLFYRQEDDGIPQSIRDTLPYFLGAVGDEQLNNIQRLRRAKRELKLLQRRLEDEESIVGRDNSRALELLSEARQMGIIGSAKTLVEREAILAALREALNWSPAENSEPSNSQVRRLRDQRQDLLNDLESVQVEVEAARSFALDQKGFSVEAGEQKNRLEAIGLYRHEEAVSTQCPLCQQNLDVEIPTATNIRESLERINAQIDSLVRQTPRLEAYIQERLDRVDSIRQTITENKAGLEAIYAQEEAIREQRNETARQARVVGRISLFLDSAREVDESAELRDAILAAERKVNRLEKLTASSGTRERLDASLSVIGSSMSAWAKRLRIEHSEYPMSLDVQNLTVRGFDGVEPITMAKMGSGANWVGCHLIAHLGLHEWFINQNRPVPRFLFLDQPTQAYFPPDESVTDRSVDDLIDEDRVAVNEMFRLIFDVVEELSPNLQIIITDHADLPDSWFQDAVIERWRGGQFLVPDVWE